jgi:PAS domain S-box-containing protein
LLALIAILACRAALTPILDYRAPTLVLTVAVMIAASLGGLGPGVLAMVLGFLVARYFWIRPIHHFAINTPDLAIYALVYFGVATAILLFSLLLRASLRERTDNEQRFGSLFKYNLDAVFVLDPQGRIAGVNPQAIRLTGFSEEEFLGKMLDSFCRPDQVALVHQALRMALEGCPRDFEFTLLKKDGTSAELQFSTGPMIIEREITGVFGVAKDITERKRAEQELRASEERFRALFQDRKRFSEELLQAKEEAENANIAKDRFLAILSHELRTPLNPVLMGIHAWENEEGLPGQLIQDLKMMRHNIEIEVRLISDLLDLTAISKGKLSLEYQPVNVHELLDYALHTAEPLSLEKKIRISEELSADSHYVLSDGTRLQQVFWNLINNAIKFTPNGGSIGISTRNEASEGESAGKRIVIEVRDSGMGMEAKLIERIFEPFEQGSMDVTNHFGGLGLGLSIARGFVELLGGTIHAHSEGEGQGSVFSVKLKAMRDPFAQDI